MSTTRTPYTRMDGSRRPSIFATDKAFTGAHKATCNATKANARGFNLHLRGTPELAPHKGAFSKAGSA